jgi:ABC-type dipeptide/oligopeptide/nickel transport system ATPase component
MECLLKCDSVEVSFGGTPVVHGVSFSLAPAKVLGIVGESGSGKSTVIRALMGLLGPGGAVTKGDIWFEGKNLPDLPEREMRGIRGSCIAMIFQDAKASLCPIRTIGSQIFESIAAHRGISPEEARREALALFTGLDFKDPARVWDSYPFELSGGMNQRVAIAAAMIMRPSLLLADEPTSALDAAVQKQVVLELLRLRDECGSAVIIVTHDIGVVSRMADDVLVMKDGRMVEYGPARDVLGHPKEEYTKTLLAAVPKLRRKNDGTSPERP